MKEENVSLDLQTTRAAVDAIRQTFIAKLIESLPQFDTEKNVEAN